MLTRIGLEAIGVAARAHFWLVKPTTLLAFSSIWNVWDTNWYLGIAEAGYSTSVNAVGNANYAFFPLYPALIRLVSILTNDYLLAGLIVSNACLLIACFYLYRFVALDSPEETALRSVKYLFLFPTAFIFSAALTESLFLALAIACLYYARKGNWPIAGTLGFLIALSRPPGVIIILPLLYEYYRQHRFTLKPGILALALPPLGLSAYAAYNYYLTGDPLAFMQIQSTWGGSLTLPIEEMYRRFTQEGSYVVFGALFTVAAMLAMAAFYRKVDFGAWLLGFSLILIPLFTPSSCYSMLRYITVVFPLFIISARLGEDRRIDTLLTILFAGTQIVFMVMWTTWSPLIV